MKEITGPQLYYAFAAGGQEVIAQREDLNRMNVYPVPDGDTGSNLSFTLKNIIEQTKIFPGAGPTMQSLAESALTGARGNSGILFAQFVNGMAEKLGNASSITMEKFTHAVHHASETAYKAISNPVEGTMLTVMRDFALSLKEIHISAPDFKSMMNSAMAQVSKSLEATKTKLEALKKANVIDAGAKGFVTFLEGFHRFLEGGAQPDEIEAMQRPQVTFSVNSEHHEELEADEDLTFRYCTEGYVVGSGIDLEQLRSNVEDLGDCLIVAGSSAMARVHIHTDRPDMLFERMAEFGEIREQKADDMHRQYQMVHARKSEIALVIDSTCDLPEDFLDTHQIYEVPLLVNFGDKQFLDGLTLKTGRFYEMLRESKEFPKTSQPNVKTFEKLYDHLTSHYTSVISISMSSGLSGTHNASSLAARSINGAKISTLDSLQAASGIGILAYRTALDIEEGLSHDEVVDNFLQNRGKTQSFVLAKSIDNFVRGGRVSPLKGFFAKLLNIKPVLGVDKEGKAYFRAKGFGLKNAENKIIREISDIQRNGPGIRHLAIVHANDIEGAQRMANRIQNEAGVKAEFIDEISPVLGAHAGDGCFDISFITN